MALAELTDLSGDRLALFISQLAGDAAQMPTTEFDILSAQAVAEVVPGFTDDDAGSVPKHVTPLVNAKLCRACADLAGKRGGAVARAFATTGLNGEVLVAPELPRSSPKLLRGGITRHTGT